MACPRSKTSGKMPPPTGAPTPEGGPHLRDWRTQRAVAYAPGKATRCTSALDMNLSLLDMYYRAHTRYAQAPRQGLDLLSGKTQDTRDNAQRPRAKPRDAQRSKANPRDPGT